MVRVGDTQKGKPYKLVSFQTDKCDIGSTTFGYSSKRLSQHNCHLKQGLAITH